MKKALFFALVLAVVCCMASCKKPSPQNDTTPNSIVFGNTDGMIVKVYDSTDLAYQFHNEEYYYSVDYTCGCVIDFNNDGTDDVCIWSSRFTNTNSPNHELISKTGLDYLTSVGSIESTKVSCENVFHNEYHHLDSTCSFPGDTIFNYYTSSCEQNSDDDVFDEDASGYMHYNISYYRGDRLSKTDYFSFPYSELYVQPHYSYHSCFYDQDFNIIQEIYLNKQFDCYNFPLDKDVYIGIKTTEKDGTERLGWIKIYLESQPDGTHKLTRLETAIQE